jgi:hypothetical protein
MSNGDLLQSQLEYTLTFFQTCTSRSRSFITSERDTRQLSGTNLKDTLLTPKRQITADFDSNSLLGVFLLVCHKAK